MYGLTFQTLVLITLDCVRPDFLGCYGCQDVQTPALDRMASRGVVFEQAITQAPNTWVSHAGLLTGLYPPLHGLRSPYDRLFPDVPTLASLLTERGFRCAGFPGNDLVGARSGFGKGFEFYFEEYVMGGEAWKEHGKTSANNRNRWEDVLEAAEGWLGRRQDPVFLWFHYLDTHHLPDCSLPEYYRYSRDPSWQFYEGKISYADQCCIRPVLDLLARKGRYEDAVTLVASDHGEELFPGMPPAHNGQLTEGVLRVPLILFGERIPWKGVRIADLVRTVDVVPSLVGGLSGSAGPCGETSGHAFSGVPLPLPGQERGCGCEQGGEVAYAENEPLGLACLRSEQWKYVTAPQADQLFHLPSDAAEQSNVADRHPQTMEHLRRWLVNIRSAGPQGERPVLEREQEETGRLLRAFGYLE